MEYFQRLLEYTIPNRLDETSWLLSITHKFQVMEDNEHYNLIMKRSQTLKLQASSIEQYQLGKTVGEGTFGKVRLAKHKATEQLVAIKIMYKERIMASDELNRVTKQIAILKSISHPNTVKLYEIIQSQSQIFLVMEYVETDLMEYIQKNDKITESEAAKILFQILTGIQYLHSLGIAHRDLKPNNILLTKDKVVKIADFGLSNMYKIGNKLQSPVGSPCYAAPELIQGKSYNPLDIDLWSFGIIMYVLLTGELPFNHKNVHQLYKLILSVKYEVPEHISKLAKDLLKNILITPASKRFKTKQIKSHPWMYYHTKNFQLPKAPDWKHRQQLVLNVLQKQGYKRNQVQTNIDKKKHNKLTTLYHLYQRKGTFRLEQMMDNKLSKVTPLKTPRKIIRKPGLTPVRMRSATPKQRSHNASFQTYVKIRNKLDMSHRIQTAKTVKYIPSFEIMQRKSLGSIPRFSFLKKSSGEIESYFGPYNLDGVFSTSAEKLKQCLVLFFKRERCLVEQVSPWRFQVKSRKQIQTYTINNLNDIKNVVILRTLNNNSEESIKELFSFIRKQLS